MVWLACAVIAALALLMLAFTWTTFDHVTTDAEHRRAERVLVTAWSAYGLVVAAVLVAVAA